VNFLAPKLIQLVIAIGSIQNLDTGSYFAINLVNFLTPKLIPHNLDTGLYFAINLVNFLAPKLIQHVIAIASTLFFEIKYVRDKIIQVNNLKEG
jgi:hypothetical protein